MPTNKGRPSELNDVIARHRMNRVSWYTWEKYDENGNKIPNKDRMQYKYLKVIDGGDKPTEDEVNSWLTKAQSDWDNENKTYKLNRAKEYPSIKQQLDDIYHNGIDGWKATIKATKDKYPKE